MQKKLLISAVLALILIGGVVFVWQKKMSQEVSQNSTKNDNSNNQVEVVDWKTYRNEQMGIQFSYPSSWGEIILSKEVGCVDYYAEKVMIPENNKDDCLHITLSASNFDRGAFFAAEGTGFTNTEIPRGADWRYRFLALPKDKVDFCSNNPYISMGNRGGSLNECDSFKTSTGLSVTKGVRPVPFSESEAMTVYFIRTNHPVYYDLVISPQYLMATSPTAEEDIRKLVETMESF